MTRHRFLAALAAASLFFGGLVGAQAQTYPSKPVRLVVGSPPGALGDVLARMTAQHVGEQLGQPLVVDNKPGASLAIAADSVA